MDLVSNRQHIARWLQELIVEVGEEYTPKLALRHITVNDRQQEVASFAPQKLGDDEGVFGELVRRIGDAIDRDAEGLGGVQRYLLVATADDRVVARLPLRCSAIGSLDGDGGPIESEPPTSRGQVSQQMRHNEALMRMFVLGMGQVVSTMQRTIVRLQQSSDLADDRRLEAVEIAERLLSEEKERELAGDRAKHDKDIQTKGLSTFMTFASLAAGALFNKNGGGHFVKLLKELTDTFDPAQIDKLIDLLKPEQVAKLQQLLTVKMVEDPTDPAKLAAAATALQGREADSARGAGDDPAAAKGGAP